MGALDDYMSALRERSELVAQQSKEIHQAATACADAIGARHWVHVFGAGHSRMMAEESYPRIGGLVGFHPIVELALTYFTPVIGNNGLKQAIFLEKVPGYGRLILEEVAPDQKDVLLVFSSSGVEHVVIDMVRAAKAKGLTVIGVTSLDYSSTASRERGGVPRLADLSDITIDNHVPVGDAVVPLQGLDRLVGPSSSILNLTVMNLITVTTAELMLARDVTPMVFASPHLDDPRGENTWMDDCLADYRGRLKDSL